ncbi:TraR/DksA C4-type zinc finger protein [Sporosarcina sp. GW1-11]|uniref:TraR/DksA C4-type zinc finger protein n=1 Tax=Sporosarcina sp. GW1-11 TaxID=2899126 RepID=UPI00294D2977|nr:TraR/DksA C4-type zinc finger protein [Sporosarcina sp. GW1-11]MDV6378083.1 TraR/DksA C4-type zinc finger protein [Sporosarcina sp. GW1-11]
MLTTQQLDKLKNDLKSMEERLSETTNETEIVKSVQEDVGELSMYDNHPADMGTELYEREKDLALNTHAVDELEKVQHALQAIKEGTYGICEECGKKIPYERLEAIPYTTVCIEDAEKAVLDDRPVEDDILLMAEPNSFAERRSDPSRDYEDSFQEIAKSGTSETPSDFIGNENRDYDDLYDEDNDKNAEEFEEFVITDITGQPAGFVPNEEALDENPLGDIPYHKGDSYVEHEK